MVGLHGLLLWFIMYQLLTYFLSIGLYYFVGIFILDYNYSFLEIIDSSIYIILLGIFLFLSKKLERNKNTRSTSFAFNFNHLMYSIIIVLLFRVTMDPIIRINEIFSGELAHLYREYNLNQIQLILKFVNIVIFLPILEELVYRRIFFKLMRRETSIKAILITSLFFMIGHISFYPFQFDFIRLLLTFFFSLILGLTYVSYGLKYSILIHILYNLFWFFDTFISNFYKDCITYLQFSFWYWVIILSGLFSLMVIIYTKLINKTKLF